MTETIYHADLGLPSDFVAPTHRIEISYGAHPDSHARAEARADRYGEIRLPKTLSLKRMKVIEVGVEDGRISKILFRGRLDETRDLCIVLIPKGNKPWFAKTAWVNTTEDTHKTLDKSRYQIPA
jgi:hypothetical protein